MPKAERSRQPDLFLGYLQGTEAPADKRQRLYLTNDDRKTGLHVIGAPNTGKSKFMEHLIRQDIRAGQGLCLIDPHGALYDDVLEWCAFVRPLRPVIPLNLSTGEHVIGCNPFIRRGDEIATQVDRCLAATVKAQGAQNTDQTPRLDRVMGNVYHAIVEADDLTLCEADYFLTHSAAEIRAYLTSRVEDDTVRGQLKDLARLSRYDDFMSQVESTQNRLNRILRAKVARRFLALTDPAMNLDYRRIMDEGAILLVNLKRSDRLTEQNQRLFGTFLVNAFIDEGFRRPPNTARPFTLYLDEFYNFMTRDIGQALPQLRKFNVRFVLAHQTFSQLRREDADILEEVMGAVKARVVFGGLQHKDALQLAPDMFAGQTDYTEVKYWRDTVKFWPVYDRDIVRTRASGHTDSRGRAHTDIESDTDMTSHTDAVGSSSQSAEAHSQQGSSGHSVPYLSGLPSATGGQYFDSSGWGFVSTSGGGSSESSADSVSHAKTRGKADTTSEADADTTQEGEADVPIYRHVPYVERQPDHFGLDEQRDRQATLLMLQYQRHCFVRSPGDLTKPLLIPNVPRFKLDPAIVSQYEADMAKKAGAKTPAQVDEIHAAQRERIEHAAAVPFDVPAAKPVHSSKVTTVPASKVTYEPITIKPGRTRTTVSKPGRKPGQARAVHRKPKADPK